MSGAVSTPREEHPLFSGKALLWLTAFCLTLSLVIDQTQERLLTTRPGLLIPGLLGLIVLVLLLIFWWRRRANWPALTERESTRTENWLLLLMIGGFLLRLWYVLYTPVNVRQHDVFYFGADEPMTTFNYYRHAEYIEYVCRYLSLPNVDPTARGLSQLYHPPLHHLLAGLWLRLQSTLWDNYSQAVESIQLLPLLYSSACMLLCGRLFCQLGLKGQGLILATALVCFHPTLILLAGSVNNDMLSITLGLAALSFTVSWYNAPSLRTIMPVALAVGGSMMTKLSGGLLAPGIAVVFLWRAGRDIRADKAQLRVYFRQFAAFAAVCVPLALWWQTRNLILYDTPLAYVPGLSSQSSQYIGDYSPWQRLFGLPLDSLTNVFEAWKSQGAAYNEYSIPLALFKTASFDESTLFAAGVSATETTGLVASYLLFYSHILLALIATVAMVVAWVKSRWLHSPPVTTMLWVIWLTLLFSFVTFCFRYPHTCTQNFRYLVPTLVIGTAFLGQLSEQLRSRPLRYALAGLTGLFGVSSAAVYTLLGLVK